VGVLQRAEADQQQIAGPGRERGLDAAVAEGLGLDLDRRAGARTGRL
jgi:hypothetical protein